MPETRLQAHASALVTRHKPRLTPIMQNRDAHLYATYTVLKSTIEREELPDYKPVFVPVRATVIPLGPPLLTGSSDLPGSQAERAAPSPLFGLAPRGVCPAGWITPAAVRSYRTISPLPRPSGEAVYFLWHLPYPAKDPGR